VLVRFEFDLWFRLNMLVKVPEPIGTGFLRSMRPTVETLAIMLVTRQVDHARLAKMQLCACHDSCWKVACFT